MNQPDPRGARWTRITPPSSVGDWVLISVLLGVIAGVGIAVGIGMRIPAQRLVEDLAFYKLTLLTSVLQCWIASRPRGVRVDGTAASSVAWFTPIFVLGLDAAKHFLWFFAGGHFGFSVFEAGRCLAAFGLVLALALGSCFLAEHWARANGRRVRASGDSVPLAAAATIASIQMIWAWTFLMYAPLVETLPGSNLRLDYHYIDSDEERGGSMVFRADGTFEYRFHADHSERERIKARYRLLDTRHLELRLPEGEPLFALEIESGGNALVLRRRDDPEKRIDVYVAPF